MISRPYQTHLWILQQEVAVCAQQEPLYMTGMLNIDITNNLAQ